MTNFPIIAVTALFEQHVDAAKKLAQQLAIPYATLDQQEYAWLLVYTADRLELRQTGEQAPGPIYVDFLSGKTRYRYYYGGGQRQPLAKAVGIKKGHYPLIWDATAGLGRDAFVLAGLGCTLILSERSPIISALLANGLQRLAADPLAAKINMQLVAGDAIHLLPNLPIAERPAVIYLDPMYPHREQSALVKKEMRALRELVGDDSDVAELLAIALKCATERVVVKRPSWADPIAGQAPSFIIANKNSRFDVYRV